MSISSFTAKSANEKYCSHCGNLIYVAAEICPRCGVRQHPPPHHLPPRHPHEAPNGKNRLAAALFAIFLGTFGIHKFYLGQVGLGIVYLLFFWTAIPGIIGFIEGIVLLAMTDARFIEKYGHS